MLAEIDRLKRSEFNEWTLYQISNGRFPQYLKLSSIRQFGDRVAVQVKAPVDPAMPGNAAYPQGSVHEDALVFDCKQSTQAISEIRIVAPSRALLFQYKNADPEAMDMSNGTVIAPGTIAETAKNILCDDRLRTPLVTRRQLAILNSTDATEEELASMNFHELQRNNNIRVYYQPIQNEGTSEAEKDAIVVMIPNVEFKIADEAYGPQGSSVELGTFRTEVYWQRIRCGERKSLMLKRELYDASNDLKFIGATALAQPTWAEFKESAPLGSLQRILCAPRQVQK